MNVDQWESDLRGSAVSVLLGGCGENGEVGAKRAESRYAGDSEGETLAIVADPDTQLI